MPVSASARALTSLKAWARAQDVAIDNSQRGQLEVYLDNLLLWNQRLALVSQTEPLAIVEKHFADALVAARYCRGATTIIDLGSGAGFPGLIIAIQYPDASVTLVESRLKKASFLVDTARAANLANVQIVADRIEVVARRPEHTRRYEISIARALGSVTKLLEYSRALLNDTGRAIAMKGPSYRSEIDALSIERLGFRPPIVRDYSLPDLSKRVLLTFVRL
jgi:16S rRNA (guanine527-N7)-methyltransferase